jgi:hypothetical protein
VVLVTKTLIAGRRRLSLCQGIDLIVVNQIGDVMIAAQRVEEVIPALSVAIAVTAHSENRQLRIGHLGPGSRGERSAVKDVEHVAVEVVRQFARLADTRDHEHPVGLDVELNEGALDRCQDGEIAAARAPGGGPPPVVRHLDHG